VKARLCQFFRFRASVGPNGLDGHRPVEDHVGRVGEGQLSLMFPNEPLPRTLEGFEILERLGAGAAGEVFLARSRGGRLVAIKTIARAQGDDGPAADAFVREASVCARLRHPCIVEVRAFLEERGVAALVFEYVPGVALARVLRLCEARGVRMPDRSGWHIVERVLDGLTYAHSFRDESGKLTPIIHRDLSPSNVLLDWNGGVKIADFGIAKVLGVSPTTRLGLVKGTPGCMAPEQARGEAVNERADVYAAALLAWRLATGRSPFGKHQKDEIELLRAMRHPNIPTLAAIRPDLPPALLDAVSRALEPDPERRTIGAAELAAAVRAEMAIDGGADELRLLLEQRRPALERAVKPNADGDVSPQTRNDTQRYEEAALAFDEQPLLDAPTFVAHALPSEPTPIADRDTPTQEAESALPPDLPNVPAGRRSSGEHTAVPGSGLLLVVFIGLGLLAVGIAAFLR
jgi:serine/threonine protein kinase